MRGTCKLEVIDVYNEEKTILLIEVHGRPLRANGSEAGFADGFVTMFLPHRSAIWVSIQGSYQSHDWFAKFTLPRRRPGLLRETDPARITSKTSLNVCLDRIGDLDVMFGEAPIGIRGSRRI